MPTTPLSRSTARTLTLAVQLLAVPLLAGAALVFGGGFGLVPWLETTEPAPIEIDLPQVTLPGVAATTRPEEPIAELDVAGIASRLALLGNAPKPDEPEPTDEPKPPDTDTPIDPSEQTIRDRVRYLGLMRAGSRTMALLDVDGRQRVVAGGRAVPGLLDAEKQVMLLAINPDKIVLRGNDSRIAIERAPIDRPATSASKPTNQTAGTPRNTKPNVGQIQPDRGNATSRDPLERRRKALQKAVERGSLSQEEADRLLEQAAERQAEREARNEARRMGEDN